MSILVGTDFKNLSTIALSFIFSEILWFVKLVHLNNGLLWQVRFKVSTKYNCKVVRYTWYNLYVVKEILSRGHKKIKHTICSEYCGLRDKL